MSKLKLTDSTMVAIVTMSEGNPGALSCVMGLLQSNPKNMIYAILPLDDMGIYGSRLYMLWNDCCERDTKKLEGVMELYRHGKISGQEIVSKIDVCGGYGENIDLSEYEGDLT